MATPSFSLTPPEEPPLEAGPSMPRKRGEIGYSEDLHGNARLGESIDDNNESRPSRHPADTGPASSHPEIVQLEPSVQPRSLLPFFNRKRRLQSTTTLLLIAHTVILLITISVWVVISIQLKTPTLKIFVHTSFGAAVMVQVIFFERAVYVFRVERYARLHPVLPGGVQRGPNRLGINPWRRPPLPTYAAVLYESGVATGDAEDAEIPIQPAPAYGVTGGSRLVMSGPISQELINQSRLSRLERGESLNSMEHSPYSRPISYVSYDVEWEERCDAYRAMVLQETLNRLEDRPSGAIGS